MNRKIIKNLELLPFFSLNAFRSFEVIRPKALYENLQRWVRSGEILRLKNGLYVTKTFVDRFQQDRSYTELIANKLAMPSYLSLEYVLQKKGLLTEATFTVTSMTLKTTRYYQNHLGSFVYHHLHSKLYWGFQQRRYGQNIIYEATPAKALFDFIYLRQSHLDPEDISTLESMRINWSEMDSNSFRALCEMLVKSHIKKMQKMIPLLKEMYHGNFNQRSRKCRTGMSKIRSSS